MQHLKCGKITYVYNQIKDLWLCSNCNVSNTMLRYNPFDSIIINEFIGDSPEYYEDVITFQKVLTNCKESKIQDIRYDNKNLSLLFNNIDGMSSNFDSLHSLLGATKSRFGIVAIAETNIEPHHKDLYTLPGYQSIFGEKRKGKRKGSGVGIYFNESYVTDICRELTVCSPDVESLVVKINNLDSPIIISVIYRPPNGCIEAFLKYCEKLLSSIPSNSIICGDFNINLLNKDNKMTKFENVVLGNSYIPTISLPTHLKPGCTPSCIDNILVSNPENVTSSFVIEQSVSHHSPIACLLELPGSNIVEEDADEQNIPQYDYCESNIIEFNRNLSEKLAMSKLSADEKGFEMFLECFNETHEQCCKVDPLIFNKSKRNRLTNPWINNGLIRSINLKNSLYKKWKVTCTKKVPRGDESTYKKYKDYRKHLKHLINYSKKQFHAKRFDQTKGDSKKTWKLINELRGKSKSKLKSHFIINGSLVKTRRIIADEFNNYFSSIALKLNAQAAHNQHAGIPITPLPTFNNYLIKRTPNSIYLYDCNTEEIHNIIKELDSNKSSDISIRLVKMSANITSPFLSKYFSLFMQNGTFPRCLKQGTITPVYKKGNPQLLDNYRPISTLPCFGKIFEKVIYKRLYSFFSSNQLINENQFGFRSKHSTSHAINYSIDKIVSETENQKHVLGIFIDLSKAFDTICHTKLTCKLEHYGIRGNALNLIESYLSDRSQLVNFNGSKSDYKPSLMGVPQGSVLGPLLFIIYINDITQVSKMGDFVMFADDTNIFVSGNSVKDAFYKANILLSKLYNYMLVNQLHINQSKCVFMHFKPKLAQYKDCTNSKLESKLSINGADIKCVNKARFLGVVIDDKLTWNDQIDSLAEKLNSCIISIKRIKKFIPKEHYMKLYHSLFVSHLTYGISAWGGVSHSKLSKLFSIQKRCLRLLFGKVLNFDHAEFYRTCARVRTYSEHIAPKDFSLEHTKPLFKEMKLLTVHHLYYLYTFNELFKIRKYSCPTSLLLLIKQAHQYSGKHLKLTTPKYTMKRSRIQFLYKCTQIWNSLFPKVFNAPISDVGGSVITPGSAENSDFVTTVAYVKTQLKKILSYIQNNGDLSGWQANNLIIEL